MQVIMTPCLHGIEHGGSGRKVQAGKVEMAPGDACRASTSSCWLGTAPTPAARRLAQHAPPSIKVQSSDPDTSQTGASTTWAAQMDRDDQQSASSHQSCPLSTEMRPKPQPDLRSHRAAAMPPPRRPSSVPFPHPSPSSASASPPPPPPPSQHPHHRSTPSALVCRCISLPQRTPCACQPQTANLTPTRAHDHDSPVPP